jgi:hypothetical protein
VNWKATLDEGIAATSSSRGILAYLYYPVSAAFVHPLNYGRDYCENRLFSNFTVCSLLNGQLTPVMVNLADHPETADMLGVSRAAPSICLCDSKGVPVEKLMGDDLLLSPPELVAKMNALGGKAAH